MGLPGVRREQGRLREELGLSSPEPEIETILRIARASGFTRVGFVDPDALRVEAMTAAARRGGGGGMEWGWVLSPQSWRSHSSILIGCLSCFRSEPDDLSTPDDPHALIAPFARRHYYRIASRMMQDVARGVARGLRIPRRAVRVFCNSRIPEKPLLAAAGLGGIGKNSLAIVPGLGSLFVIAGAVIPRPLTAARRGPAPVGPPSDPCGSCTRCIDACPVGAITQPGIVDPDMCLQGLAARPLELSPEVMETWGRRLYGCQTCQAVCPHNRGLTEEGPGNGPGVGAIGPSVSLKKLLAMNPDEIAAFFRGTAMGLSWVSGGALLRNALIAAGASRYAALAPLVQTHAESGLPGVRAAALWARGRLG